MKFPPVYRKTDTIEGLCKDLDILKAAYLLASPQQAVLTYLQRKSLLKSSLYSARIEGNPMRIDEVSEAALRNPQSLKKREIANIASAISFLNRSVVKKFDVEFLRDLHRYVLRDVSSSAGSIRIEESAIFNQAGIAVFITPAPQHIHNLLKELLQYANTSTDHPTIRAAVSHIWFEKIHPFLDGNGRVGRLLSLAILKKGGYDFGGIVPIEEYIESHRQEYYDALGRDIRDVTPFVEFFLTALVTQTKISLEELKKPIPQHRVELLPRRAEILDTIRDHRMVSFDFISRRFRAVTKSTLHFDLQQLIKGGYIKRLGSTRGSVYVPVD